MVYGIDHIEGLAEPLPISSGKSSILGKISPELFLSSEGDISQLKKYYLSTSLGYQICPMKLAAKRYGNL